jgi:outer membrane lipoprotein SlyB
MLIVADVRTREVFIMSTRIYLLAPFIGLCAIVSGPSLAQRAGQSVNVQFGVVRSAQEIDLDSNAPSGALIGGTLGIISAGGRSTARTVRNGIIGAGAGGALGGATQGSRRGMSYTVAMMDGSTTTIVTDQRDIREGDCVAIERVRDTSNIRRAASSYCDKQNQRAVSSVEDHTRSDAVACESAKQALLESTPETAELAARKVELLCNG